MKRICLYLVVFLVIFISLIARIFPPKTLYVYDVAEDDIIETLTEKDIKEFHCCELSKAGKIIITGSDANIVFDVDKPFASISLNINASHDNFEGRVYFDSGDGYSEINSIASYGANGQSKVVFPSGSENIKRIRIDIDVPYELESVDFHSTKAFLTPYKHDNYLPQCFIMAIISLVFTVAIFLLDLKFGFSQKIFSFILKKRKSLFIIIAMLLFSGVNAFAIEYIIDRSIIGASSLNNSGIYRFVFITAVIFSVLYLIFCVKSSDKKIENVFLGICLILGITMIIVTPFGHNSWDTDSHYRWALRASYLNGDAVITQAENAVLINREYTLLKRSAEETTQVICDLNDQYSIVLGQERGSTTIAHYPSGLFIAIARMFGGSFYEVFTFGKFANIFVYAFVCYFAIKKLKSGKMILIVIALFPTNLVLATSYSYDYWVAAFGFLGMAYFVGELQTPEKPMSIIDTIVMCVAFSLMALPKLVYAVFLVVPFFMKREKLTKPKLYYTICTLTIVSMLLLLAIRSFSVTSSDGDIRGGTDVSAVGQINFIISQPVHYAKILLNFLRVYLSVGTMKEYIVNYAYCGIGAGSTVFAVLMAITTLTDKNRYDIKAYNWWTRALVCVLFFGTAAAIATALYIAFTPVGYETINGCQPRYIIPLLYPLLSVLCGRGIRIKINQKIYNYACLVPCIFVNMLNISTVLLKHWA